MGVGGIGVGSLLLILLIIILLFGTKKLRNIGSDLGGGLRNFKKAMKERYGEPQSLEEFDIKAQVMNYELMRPMFEAFRANKTRATGVIQWMLNAAWPKMYWQLYDYFLKPNGAYYGTKKACSPLQLIYNYGDFSIYLGF